MSPVSVVIPAYNAERFIRKAVDSALAQTVPVHEVLVIDDGSTDTTPEIVESYGGVVRLVRQANGGPARARNRGMRLAAGAFVAFLDADDAWRADKLEKQLAAMQARPEAILCYTSLQMVLPTGVDTVDHAYPADKVAEALRVCNPGITPSSVLIARETLLKAGGFDERQNGCEDWELWVRLSRMGPFCVVDEPVTIYLVSNTGLSSDADRVFVDFERMLDRVLLSDLRGVQRALWRRRILSYQTYKAGLTARGAGEREKERRYLLRSAMIWPSPLWYPHRFKAMMVTALGRSPRSA